MIRQTKRRTAGRRNFENGMIFQSSKLDKLYSHRLSFYDIPPLDEITLEEFELWAIDRLKVLIEIESCIARSKSVKEMESIIKPLLSKYLPISTLSKGNEKQIELERKKDHYSHFILRLVFCRSEDLRKKFIKTESILFKIRYNLMQPKEQTNFINDNNDKLNWSYINNEEKEQMFEQLFNATGSAIRSQLIMDNENLSINNEQLRQHVKMENFIKLPFEKIPHLLSARSIFIRNGEGYIPTTLQINLLVREFQNMLENNLIKTFQSLPRLDEDDRLLPVLNSLSRNFASVQYEVDSNNENVGDINSQSILTNEITKHYPLCGKHLQKTLSVNHHLRYQGRQQLGLFLKGIGLNIDEALKFWSNQFSANMTMEKFNKEYKYNIRHNYGLEGARNKYRPWDCATILSKPKPNKQEAHGCPYRDLNLDSLVSNLNDMGINDQKDINGVIEHVNKNEYTVACTKVFELTHKNMKGNENLHINHPNLYFDRSRQLEKSS
ncbi:DNA primase large subunit [[Candida] jaroonii]|uniref:DNA primase large subunit n=1 Tax=[Candida] jaroonii TaxID=467808 RepID=A0ACA9YB01_9ASCO|nr:DNA primase large subunit [[Candida] jaroonii]